MRLISGIGLFLLASVGCAQGVAQGAQPGGFNWGSIAFLAIFIGIFYFLMIRPQMKRNKEHRQMLGQLAKGDEVVTTGGILGRVSAVGDSFITLSVSENVDVQVQKSSIGAVMPKGTVKFG